MHDTFSGMNHVIDWITMIGVIVLLIIVISYAAAFLLMLFRTSSGSSTADVALKAKTEPDEELTD